MRQTDLRLHHGFIDLHAKKIGSANGHKNHERIVHDSPATILEANGEDTSSLFEEPLGELVDGFPPDLPLMPAGE